MRKQLSEAERRILDLATEDEYPLEQVVLYLEPLFPGVPPETWQEKALAQIAALGRRGWITVSGVDDVPSHGAKSDVWEVGILRRARDREEGPLLLSATKAGERAYFDSGAPHFGGPGSPSNAEAAPQQPERDSRGVGRRLHTRGTRRALPSTSFRRRRGQDTWHFCPNCSSWPETEYDEAYPPPKGEFCDECRAKYDVGSCG